MPVHNDAPTLRHRCATASVCHGINTLWHRYATAYSGEGGLRMRTIALIAQKGGVGKSTLAINLAVAAVQAGETVIGIDTDQQGTLAAWAASRSATTPAIAHIGPRVRRPQHDDQTSPSPCT